MRCGALRVLLVVTLAATGQRQPLALDLFKLARWRSWRC
jgi:hypothetical protein